MLMWICQILALYFIVHEISKYFNGLNQNIINAIRESHKPQAAPMSKRSKEEEELCQRLQEGILRTKREVENIKTKWLAEHSNK